MSASAAVAAAPSGRTRALRVTSVEGRAFPEQVMARQQGLEDMLPEQTASSMFE